MDNPVAVFVLGLACGAAIPLFAMLAVWMRLKDAALSVSQQSQSGYLFSKDMVWAGLLRLMLAGVALAGARDPVFGWPHLEWITGVLIGAVVPLGLRHMARRGKPERHR